MSIPALGLLCTNVLVLQYKHKINGNKRVMAEKLQTISPHPENDPTVLVGSLRNPIQSWLSGLSKKLPPIPMLRCAIKMPSFWDVIILYDKLSTGWARNAQSL